MGKDEGLEGSRSTLGWMDGLVNRGLQGGTKPWSRTGLWEGGAGGAAGKGVQERAEGKVSPRLLQARDRKVSGDVEAARHFSSKARCYNALATAGSVLLPLLLGALIVTGVIHLSKLAHDSVGFFTYQFSGSDDEDQ